jgi:protein TonB
LDIQVAGAVQTNFDEWTRPKVDRERRARLLIGYVVGLGVVGATGAFIVLSSNQAKAEERDETVLEAQLAREPEAEPEPPPEIATEPKPEAQRKPPPAPKIAAPTEIPTEPLKEAEVDRSQLADESDPFQRDTQAAEPSPAPTAEIAPIKVPVAPSVVFKPEKKAPIRVTEEVTPPAPVDGNIRPDYPSDAKAAGIEGVVLVKYVVTETGAVTDVRVIKGPPELSPSCITAVKTWRFSPAMLEGKPVAVVRVARFPFKIRT